MLLSLYFKEGRHRGKILVWKKFLLNSRINLSAFILLQILYCVVKIAEVRHKGEFENLIDCLSSLVSSDTNMTPLSRQHSRKIMAVSV